jgi:hypothetical protein
VDDTPGRELRRIHLWELLDPARYVDFNRLYGL